MRPAKWRIDWRAYAMVLVLILVAIGFEVLTNHLFLSSRNLVNLARQASLTAILAVGMVPIIVSGNIDLSAGSAVGLTAILAAWVQVEQGWSTPAAITLAILAGLMMGAAQGACIAWMRVPSFVVTLAGMLVFRGIGLVITQGNTISPLQRNFVALGQDFLGAGASFAALSVVFLAYVLASYGARRARRRLELHVSGLGPAVGAALALLVVLVAIGWVSSGYLGVPYPVVALAVLALLFAALMRRTTLGRHLYAIGGNREACRLSGISVERDTFVVFVLMGGLYGIVGVLLAARLNAAPPNAGTFMELEAIAAAVIGGTSLMGGVGTIGGAVVGALLMASISNGMSLMNILTYYQLIVTGLLLVLAVYLDMLTKRRPT